MLIEIDACLLNAHSGALGPFFANVRRFLSNRPLRNRVVKARQY